MSDTQSLAPVRFSPRGFTRALMVGGFCVAAAWLIQNGHHGAAPGVAVRRPVLARWIGPSAPMQPSAFDKESTMSPSQLMGRWDAQIDQASRRFHVPRAWIRAVMAHESGGRTMLGPDRPIISSAGAVGLMQLLPATYIEMAGQYRLGSNPFDTHDNIIAGTAYLRWLRQKYGFPAMFAAYNAGPGRLEDHLENGARLPAETRAYIGSIARTLNHTVGPDLVTLTRPDGVVVKIDPGQITAIRAALPGEFAPEVRSVITLGKHRQQGIREDVPVATAVIRNVGGLI